MEKTVSIIVLVYNTAKYLKKCLNSLINQTYKDIKIIIVNDGSTDNSLEICNEYSATDKRVKVFDKVNEGSNLARKFGLSKVDESSDYVMFVDSDDFIDVRTVEKAVNKFDDETDVVLFGYYKYSKLIKLNVKYNLDAVISHDDFMNKYYKGFFGTSAFPVNLSFKLYRKEILNDAVFYTNYMGDDLCINIQVLPKVRKFVVIDEPLYYYRFGGGTSKFNPNFLDDYSIIKNFKMNMRIFAKLMMFIN